MTKNSMMLFALFVLIGLTPVYAFLSLQESSAATNTTQLGNSSQQANQTFDPTTNLSSIPTEPNQPTVTTPEK